MKITLSLSPQLAALIRPLARARRQTVRRYAVDALACHVIGGLESGDLWRTARETRSYQRRNGGGS